MLASIVVSACFAGATTLCYHTNAKDSLSSGRHSRWLPVGCHWWLVGHVAFCAFSHSNIPPVEGTAFWLAGQAAIYATFIQWPFYFAWSLISPELSRRQRIGWVVVIFLLNVVAIPYFLWCKTVPVLTWATLPLFICSKTGTVLLRREHDSNAAFPFLNSGLTFLPLAQMIMIASTFKIKNLVQAGVVLKLAPFGRNPAEHRSNAGVSFLNPGRRI